MASTTILTMPVSMEFWVAICSENFVYNSDFLSVMVGEFPPSTCEIPLWDICRCFLNPHPDDKMFRALRKLEFRLLSFLEPEVLSSPNHLSFFWNLNWCLRGSFSMLHLFRENKRRFTNWCSVQRHRRRKLFQDTIELPSSSEDGLKFRQMQLFLKRFVFSKKASIKCQRGSFGCEIASSRPVARESCTGPVSCVERGRRTARWLPFSFFLLFFSCFSVFISYLLFSFFFLFFSFRIFSGFNTYVC